MLNPGKPRKSVIFLLSVDTEEEFDWDGKFPQFDCSVENVQKLSKFHRFCESYDIRPCYLVDYPVATNKDSVKILKELQDRGNAEIGAHLHPWCNPPIEGPNTDRESHVINLPIDLVKAKITQLTQQIETNIGITPQVFRTGRWGINKEVMNLIENLGFTIDSSVYPYYENEYFSCQSSFNTPYWPSVEDPDLPGPARKILEIPVTAGFNRPNFPYWGRFHQKLSSNSLKFFRSVSLAWHTGLLKKLYLSPELSSKEDMVSLVRCAIESNHPIIHMYLHSSSLIPGHKNYITHKTDVDGLYRSISHVIEYLTHNFDVNFATLSEAKTLLTNGFEGYQLLKK